MKHTINKLFAVIAIISLGLFTGCHKVSEEVTEMNLSRCLEPLNLTAKVTNGDNVTFGWDLTKGADKYALEVYGDEAMSDLVTSFSLAANEIPFTTKMEADETYYYRVQAQTSLDGREFSKWVAYDQAIKTYAVKSNLFLKVADRASNTLSFTWTPDPEVDRMEYALVSGEGNSTKTLSAEEIAAGAATIEGLNPSTNYVVILYFKSANRGEVNVWTRPNAGDARVVNTTADIIKAVTDKEAKILIQASDTAYNIGVVDISAAIEIYGEESVDGTRPVLNGEFSIAETFTGGKIYFESIEMNGRKNDYGFAIQLKNGGKAANLPIEAISYKNCNITGYSKGLVYEWGQTMVLGELSYDGCTIYEVNADGTGGGDGIDFRGASNLAKINIVNNTIYTGFRTFLRLDATPTVGDIVFKNNTIMNLCFVDNTNNGGLMGIKVKPTSLSFANNLILYEEGKASIIGTAAANLTASDAGASFSNNHFYSLPETFFNEKVSQGEALAGGGRILATDPCYNAKGGVFNLVNTDLSVAQVGAPQWFTPFVEEPEDLTLEVVAEAKTWDFTNAKYFIGDITKSKVRDNILMGVSANPLKVNAGVMEFLSPTTISKKGVPNDGYLAFKVDKPGSVYLMPVNIGEGNEGNHIIVSVGNVDGSNNSVKGGAAANVNMDNSQKILINDIAEESLVYIYASGPIGLKNLAWAFDTTQVNTALATPEPSIDPVSVTQGTGVEAMVAWDEIPNAASYSVVFNGKSYPVTETNYTISSDVVKFLDAGGYIISVFANPGDDDIYNTQSSAGKAGFTVLPKGGGGGGETVVNSVDELLNAIASGKIDITLAYNAAPYDLGTLELTTPLRLKGQINNQSFPILRGNVSISGEIGGSVKFTNISFDGTGAAGAVIVEGDAVVADTIGLFNCTIRDYSKALYDNSKKYASNVQYLIFSDIQVDNCSYGSDFIDMRGGAYHNLLITKSTFANSARTFIRTDAGSEINYATIRNNTFYKVCTNAASKDNNGLFHIRGTAGSGMIDYKIQNNIFYSILIPETPENPNGYPKFISKNSAAIKPSSITNNYFYNIEETNADYTWWTVNCSREEGIAGGGCVLSADPFKNADGGDYTLTNAVAMNANVGDPRWNPMGGGTPSSEITVSNVTDLLTAISANKTTITLEAGVYDFTALTDVAEVSGGVLTLSTSLNLIGAGYPDIIGGFKFAGAGIGKFSATGIDFNGNDAIGNFIDVSDATVNMSSVSLKNCTVTAYKNRLYSQSGEASLSSLDINAVNVNGMGTSGDFIDIRKGTANAVKVANSTFSNGIRTFMRIDASVICGAITVQNNTFYNLCSVDSKDNNGIFHVRSSSMTPETFNVKKNLFASMHRAVETPSNAAGFPKIVSSNSASVIPTFVGNYYYDIDAGESYNWWNRTDEATGTAGYGVMIAENPFKDAAALDFTLTNALAASENVGDPRWNPNHGGNPGEAFQVANVEELLTAISAGKTNIALAYGTYDLTTSTDANVSGGVLTLSTELMLKGIAKNGLKPEFIGAFKFMCANSEKFTAEGIKFTGTVGETGIGNMLEISDASVVMSAINFRNCDISLYKNRLLSMSAEAKVGAIDLTGLYVSEMGTSGDCIDIRKGTAHLVKITNSTFCNGIRTFLRVDAAVVSGSITVKNNTFYNLCSVDSKDNNGILHVRSTALPEGAFIAEKNIFATMHRAAETPSNANGYPKLLSSNSAGRNPEFRGNLFFDFDTTEGYSWWSRIDEATAIANGGAVLAETPFAGDPTTGKFTVKAEYKGYGDLRW